MRAAWAFVVRDFRIAWSYRFGFFTQYAGIVFSLVSLKLASRLFGASTPAALGQYGGDYFSFALLGVAVSLLGYPAVKTFAQGVRAAQVTGTFEAMLATRTSPAMVVLSAGIFPVLVALVELALALAIGGLVFGAGFDVTRSGVVVVVLAMTLASFVGLGLLAAAFVIAFKQTEPFTSAFLALSLMVSGVLYPVAVLPNWLGWLSALLPLTHTIELVRGLFLHDAAIGSLGAHLGALAAFDLLLPVGLASLSIALTWAKRTGSLAQY